MRNDYLIIVDVESTCWEASPPAGQQSEIIEIGVCLLGWQTGDIIARQSILVRPTRSKLSPFCMDLTTLTPAQVEAGISFAEACQILRDDYDSLNRMWASWGDYDRRMFEGQCASFGEQYPFTTQHINLKKRFAQLYKLKKPVGMAGALHILGLSLEGTHHRGGDDAANIARITQMMMPQHSQELLQG